MKKLTLTVKGDRMDCIRFGAGDHPLVLLPGLSFQGVKSAAFPLAYQYRLFAKDYTVYVLDKRNSIPEGYTVRDLSEDAAAAMEQLRLRDADIVGVSLGGMISQYLAVDHPHLVHKIALCVTASQPNKTINSVVGRWIQLAKQNERRALAADVVEKLYSPAYQKKYRPLLPLLSRVGIPKDLRRFIALANSCLTCNVYPELSKINCPAFVVGGGQDAVVTKQASEELARQLCCQIYLYPNLGHASYEEAPDFNQRIYQFLQPYKRSG